MCKKNKVADPSQPWSRGNLVKRKETYNNNESWRNQPSTKVPEKKNVDDSVEEAAEGNGVTCPGCNKYKITRCGDDHSSVHYWSSGKSKRICLSCKRNETIGQCSQCGEIRPLVLGKLFDSKMCGSCKEDKQRKRCASCHNVKVTGRESKHLVDKEGKPASICKACADKEGDMKKCGNPKCRKMAITTVRSKVHFEDGAAIQGKYICSTCHHHEKTGECPICKAHAPLDCTSIKHFNRETRLGVTICRSCNAKEQTKPCSRCQRTSRICFRSTKEFGKDGKTGIEICFSCWSSEIERGVCPVCVRLKIVNSVNPNDGETKCCRYCREKLLLADGIDDMQEDEEQEEQESLENDDDDEGYDDEADNPTECHYGKPLKRLNDALEAAGWLSTTTPREGDEWQALRPAVQTWLDKWMAAILAWIEKRIKGDWLAEMALREWTRLQDLIHEAYLQIPGSGVWPIRMLLQQGNLVESDNGVQYEPPIALQRYLFVRTYRGPWPTNSDCALCGCRTQRDFSPTNMFYLSLLSDWREKFVLPDSQFLCSEGKIQRGDNHSCAAFIERCCLPFASKRSFLRKYEEFAALHIEKSYQYINQNATLEYLAIGDFYRLLHGRQMTDFISSKPSFISHNVIGDRAWLGVFEHSAILAERGDCSPIRHHTNTVGNNFKTLDDFIKADVDSRIASGQVPANDRLEHERRQWANISAHVRCCPDQFRVGPGPGEKKRQVSWDRQCKMLDICQSPYIARTTQAARDAHVDIESATSDQYSQFHIAGKAAIPLSHFERAFDAAVISSISGYEFGLSPVEKKKLLIWEHRHAKKGLPTQLRPLTERKVNPSLYGPDRILEDIAAEGGDAGEMKRRLDEVIQRVIVCSADGYVDPFAELVDTVLASDPDHYYAGKEFFLHSDDTKLTYTPSPIYAVARAAREALHQRDPTAEIRRLQSIAKRNPALKGYDASPERLASLRRWSAKDAVLPIPTLMQVDEYREKHTKKVPFLDVLLFFGLEKVQQAGIDTRTREEGRG